MKEAFLIAEINVPDVFNDECIRDLAATANLMLTAAKFDAFKKEVRNAVVNYLRELQVLSHNKLHREVKLPRRNFPKRDAERWFITRLRDACYRAAADPPITAYELAQKLGKRGPTLPVDRRGRHRLGDGFLLVDPDGTERLHIWDAMGRWVDASKAVTPIYPIIGRMPGWTAHGDPALTGPFARMVKKCLFLVGAGKKVSAVNQINTLNRYRKAKAASPERQKLAAFLTAVHGEYGNARWRAADLFTERRQAALREALSEITNKKGKINPWFLGKWLAKHTNRWCDGLRLEKAGGRAGVTYWRARKMPEGGG
jgi:hypothetical protein